MPFKMILALLGSAVDLIYPPACAGCGAEVSGIDPPVCDACLSALPRVEKPFCQTCGAPVENPHCKRCRECPEKPHYHRARAVFDYHDEAVKKLIHGLKYDLQTRLAAPLGELLLEDFNEFFKDENYQAIIPTPLHPRRKRQREFNQATLLAQAIHHAHELPILESAVQRIKHTRPQVSMTMEQRKTNVIGAFAVKNPGAVQGAQVLVVDDVYTTGSTVNEVSRVLIEAGAKHVDVLTLSRSLMHIYHG